MIEHDDARLRLCVVTDDLRDGVDGLVARIAEAERGGATIVLLRLKHVDARTQVEVGRALLARVAIPLIVSERLDVALACGASGVHLSNGSMPVVAVRSQAPAGFLVAMSINTEADVEQARLADYATIGPVLGAHDSSVGLNGFTRLAQACGRPCIAIGGIDVASAASLRAAGAAGVAAMRGVLGAADPAAASRDLLAAFTGGV